MKLSLAIALGALTLGCGSSLRGGEPPAPPLTPGTAPREASYAAAVAAFVTHDQAGDWTAESCGQVARMFDDVASAPAGPRAPASLNAGLALGRCGDDAGARARFERALRVDPKLSSARAELALLRYKEAGDADAAIGELRHAVAESSFQNVPALVALATVSMARGSSAPGPGCKDDMDCARLDLQRALAIDDAYMPALNQLALYHREQARRRAGARATGRGRTVAVPGARARAADVQQLELAALVCSQAMKKNARYAPIHNTAGLIHYDLGNVTAAVAEFAEATRLDARSFEAWVNYGAVNLGFRGFENARRAYEKALGLRPNDYDAHVGLAIALRGEIAGTPPDLSARIAAVEAELRAAKRIDPQRPDAYFNEAILAQELKTKGASDGVMLAALDEAKASFGRFLERASGRPEYAVAVERARERLDDIAQTRAFVGKP